jgi:hypothetical protein
VYYVPFRSTPPFASVDAGLSFFGGGWDYAWNFLGAGLDPAATPDSFPTVELRFGVSQKAYRYYRLELENGTAPPGGREYRYGGFADTGIQAWDVTHHRQLEIGFVERAVTDTAGHLLGSQPATHDGTWNPDASDLGGREYLAISLRPYTGAPDPALAQDGAIVADSLWLYEAWLRRTGVGAPAAGDRFVLLGGGRVPATASDTLCFATRAATHNDVALQRSRLKDVRAVPNPYYSRSTYELSGFNRIVKFTNMPETATVRIYTLAGSLVRTLRKTDTTSSLLEWDLQNENRLPVASGVYVYTVDAPGAGSTTGRLVVFMERERLLNY